MRKILIAFFSISILFVLGSFSLPKANAASPYIKFYDCPNFDSYWPLCETINYTARYNSITSKWSVNSSNMGDRNWNDRAGSLKIIGFPKGTQVRFYENEKFGGVYITVTVDESGVNERIPFLGAYWQSKWIMGFENQITSFKTL